MTPTPPASRTPVQTTGLVVGIGLAVLIGLFFDPVPDKPAIGAVASVVALMACLWMTEAIPMAATALLPMTLFPLLGVSSASDTAGAYMNSIIFLYVGGSLIALAMERCGLHRRVALTVIDAIGGSADRIVLGFMLAGGFVSMWISNTAAAVMMLPIATAIISQMEERFGRERTRPLAVAILLAVAYSCSIGGVATPVGSPTNLIFLKVYADTFPTAPAISFGQWVAFGLPLAAALLIAAWLALVRFGGRLDSSLKLDHATIRSELQSLGPLGREERMVAGVWIVTALLWIFRADLTIGSVVIPGWAGLWQGFALVDDGTVAVSMALLLFLLPTRSGSGGRTILGGDAFTELPWGAILLFGGGFAMANGVTASGLTQYLALQFGQLGTIPVLAAMLIACVTIALLTELVSNIAVVQIFIPVLAAWGMAQGINPLLLMFPATIMSSMAFLLPVGTPPNAVIFGSNRIRISDMIRGGVWVKLVVVLITLAVSLLLMPLIFGLDTAKFPAWAAPR
jgi:solute carrier family 13 (sodium-dependent dicarboxylate transporter), member 2/3/5